MPTEIQSPQVLTKHRSPSPNVTKNLNLAGHECDEFGRGLGPGLIGFERAEGTRSGRARVTETRVGRVRCGRLLWFYGA